MQDVHNATLIPDMCEIIENLCNIFVLPSFNEFESKF